MVELEPVTPGSHTVMQERGPTLRSFPKFLRPKIYGYMVSRVRSIGETCLKLDCV